MYFNLFLIYLITLFILIAIILGSKRLYLTLVVLTVFLISACRLAVNPKIFDLLSLFGCVFISYITICSIEDLLRSKNRDLLIETEQRMKNYSSDSIELKLNGVNEIFVELTNPQNMIFLVAFFPLFINQMIFCKSIISVTITWILLNLIFFTGYSLMINAINSKRARIITMLASNTILMMVAIVGFTHNLIALSA